MKNPWLTLALPALLILHAAAHAQVGVRELSSRGMPITVLYPTAQASVVLQRGAFRTEAAPDAPALPGARRLIVLSHGSGGSPTPDHALASTLVRAGFVVAQPLHRGDNHRDVSQAGPASWQNRPAEMSETIDAVAADPMLAPLVRTDRVGVHGMSAGGVSGLALAGAQWRMLDLIRHCGRHVDEDIGFCLNGAARSPALQQLRRAQFAAGMNVPEAFLPAAMKTLHGGKADADPRPDPRVAAVSLMVPVGAVFTPESLSGIRIPVGVTAAERDEVLLPRFHSGHVLALCTHCRLLSSQSQAGHFDVLWPWPAEVIDEVAATQMRGGRPHADFTPAQRESAFQAIAQFFLQHLQP